MTIIKNKNLLKDSEIIYIKQRVKYVCKKYNINPERLDIIEISKRMKTSAGLFKWMGLKDKSYEVTRIHLAYNYYNKFGFESLIKILNHELAHFVCVLKFDKKGHCDFFKKVCKEIGGSMDEYMAGEKYKECACKNFIISPYKYEYICPGCGVVDKRKRKMPKKVTIRNVCIKCRTPVYKWSFKEII